MFAVKRNGLPLFPTSFREARLSLISLLFALFSHKTIYHLVIQAPPSTGRDRFEESYSPFEQPIVPQLIRPIRHLSGSSSSSASLSSPKGLLPLGASDLKHQAMDVHSRQVSSGELCPLGAIKRAASVTFHSNLDQYAYNWTPEEIARGRRLVQFWRRQEGTQIYVMSESVTPQEYVPGTITISCIFRPERQDYYVTSVDTIFLLESIVNARFSIEEKNRIRRNLEGFRPQTISKSKPESEEFFKTIMNFGAPKPRNIEKDVKVFPWKVLQDAVKKIVSKYSAVVEAGEFDPYSELNDDLPYYKRTNSTPSSLHRSSGQSLMDDSMHHAPYLGVHSLAHSSSNPQMTSPANPATGLPFSASVGGSVDYSAGMSPQAIMPGNTLQHSGSFPGPSGSDVPRAVDGMQIGQQQQQQHTHHQQLFQAQPHHGQIQATHSNQIGIGEPSSFLPPNHGSVHPQSPQNYHHYSEVSDGLQYRSMSMGHGQDDPHNVAHRASYSGSTEMNGGGLAAMGHPSSNPASSSMSDFYLPSISPTVGGGSRL